MNTQNSKSILAISDVIPQITSQPINKITFKSKLVLKSGQSIQLTRGLVRIAKLNQPLECCICGCTGTYMMRDYQEMGSGSKKGEKLEIWRIMSWHKEAQKPVFLTIDHIVPKHFGGTLDPKNLRIACNLCNSQRGCSLENVELPKDIPIYKEVYCIHPSMEYIRHKLKDIIKLTSERAVHFKNCVNKYLITKSQSYRRATNVEFFREAIKRALKQIGYKDLKPEIINNIVQAGAITI